MHQNPPFDVFIQGPNGTFTFSGVALHIVKWMAAKFNFTYVAYDFTSDLRLWLFFCIDAYSELSVAYFSYYTLLGIRTFIDIRLN